MSQFLFFAHTFHSEICLISLIFTFILDFCFRSFAHIRHDIWWFFEENMLSSWKTSSHFSSWWVSPYYWQSSQHHCGSAVFAKHFVEMVRRHDFVSLPRLIGCCLLLLHFVTGVTKYSSQICSNIFKFMGVAMKKSTFEAAISLQERFFSENARSAHFPRDSSNPTPFLIVRNVSNSLTCKLTNIPGPKVVVNVRHVTGSVIYDGAEGNFLFNSFFSF